MKRFTQLFQAIDATTSTNEKVQALQQYFQAEAPENAVWALYLLLGKTRKRLLTSRTLRQIFLQRFELPDWLFEECYAQVGDSAETITLLLSNYCSGTAAAGDRPADQPSIADFPLHQWMEELLPQVKTLDTDAAIADLVFSWWLALDPAQLFVLNKILTGAFRVGVSEKLVIKGLSAVSGIPEPVLAHRLMGDFTPTIAAYHQLLHTAETERSPSLPYPFCLASPLEPDRFSQENCADWWAEWKWDGIRAQVIRRAGQLFIWSRGEELITDQFPELAPSFLALPDGVVLDGEIVCWQGDRPMNFHALQKRLGRKKLTPKILQDHPAHFIAYDLLEHQSEDIRDLPFCDRRTHLTTRLQDTDPTWISLSTIMTIDSWSHLRSLRELAREQGAEGLMLKARQSRYLVGRKRGDWWKYKVDPLSLDAVLLYAQAGSGKRANLFTDYTFALWQGDRLVPFAKAYSGLDNQEIAELDKWIRQHTVEKFGPVRSLEPIQVFEIGFEGIARSTRHKSGISVRFPRILRWRKDKLAQDADTLTAAIALLDATA